MREGQGDVVADAPAEAHGTVPVRLHGPAEVPDITRVTAAHEVDALHARIREEWGDLAPVEVGPGDRAWLVTGYQAIVAIARAQVPVTPAPGGWPTVENAAGTEHQRLRAPLDEVLGSVDEAEVTRVARAACDALIDQFAETGVADLVRDYVTPLPRLTVGAFLGFDDETARQVFDAAARATSEAGSAAVVQELSFLLSAQAPGLRAGDRPSPAGRLSQHPAYGSTAEAASGLLSIVTGAEVALRAWLGRTLHLALTDEPFRQRLAGGRLGTDEALDEVLWTASPVRTLSARVAAKDFLLGDRYVESGDTLLLAVGAGNADPSVRGERPWDGSGSRAYLTFGVGAHACPAAHLARSVVRAAAETVLHRLAPVLAVPADEIRWAPDPRHHLPEALPVVFRPAQESAS